MKHFILKLVPPSLMSVYRKEKRKIIDRRNAQRSTEEVFSDIYKNNKWGGEKGEYCSGSGTVNEVVSSQYVEMIKKLAQDYDFASLKAVDLGCGDMKIGSQISGLFRSYLGADIVGPLIEHNKNCSFDGDVSFQKVNIIEENLPEGDVCFIRQVMQHLSNDQILKILEKLKAFKYVVVTEHLPSPHPDLIKNIDKPHGGGIRLYKNSGVYLDAPPFNVKGSYEKILEVSDSSLQNLEDTGLIVTHLLKPAG